MYRRIIACLLKSIADLDTRLAQPQMQRKLLFASRMIAPVVVAFALGNVAHAQGTMDFSGATTLMGTFKNPSRQLCAGILDPSRFPDFRDVRKTIWEFTRNPQIGLPSGSLPMQSEWHPKILVNVKVLLDRLLLDHQLASQDNLNMRLKKTGLPVKALVESDSEKAVIDAALRVETIHGVKGESLDAVLYLADKEHVKALVNGTGTELGRIGYVALTRARNLFWLGLLKADAETYRTALTQHTLVERQYDAQLDLPLASTI